MTVPANNRLAVGLAVLLTSTVATADSTRFTAISDDWRDPVYRQYDFWAGLGSANWRQKKPDEFFHVDQGTRATHWVYPTLSGKALLEFAMSDEPIDDKGTRVQGFSVRYYDESKARWVMAQEWPGRNSTGGVVDQLQGFYRFGRIQVFSTFTMGDPPVERTRRYTFSDIRPEGFIWHGVSTIDQGKTWTAGTLVEFTRVEPVAKWPEIGGPFHNFDNGNQCDMSEYRAFDSLEGAWRGSADIGGKRVTARLTGYRMLGGCAVLSYLEFPIGDDDYTLLEVRSLSSDRSEWRKYQLDSKKGTPHTYQFGRFVDGEIALYENRQFVIKDEFTNLTPSKIERNDADSLKKTVWTHIGEDRLAFEWWSRASGSEEWQKHAGFSFKR